MITSIEWAPNSILGKLKLNFEKADGTPYKTIVIAGENGTGKTRILQTLSTFLNLGSIEPFKEIIYEVEGTHYTITPMEQSASIGFHLRKKQGEESPLRITTNGSSREKIKEDPEDIRHYGCVFSKARSGFNTKPVKSSTTEQLDIDRYDDDAADDFTKIKQLIVDVKGQDNAAWDKIGASGEAIPYYDFHRASKIYRFEKAFNDFFDSLRFDGVDEEAADEKKVLFTKNGKRIAVDDLSTGEKQIVFRGAQLLKNSNNLNGGVVLIDEPELSMHPKWQGKIFEYYTGLFTRNESQMAQLIFATHSENVIRAAVQNSLNTLIIILSDEGGAIRADKMKGTVLPSLTAAEINYLAFGVMSIDYHIALYGYLQTLSRENTIKEADEFISQQPEYSAAQHEKPDTYGRIVYKTLPTYLRNAIDHPNSLRVYSESELEMSILLLRAICQRLCAVASTKSL